MLYIITYTTHSSGYFPLIEDHPDLKILGFGDQWSSWFHRTQAILKFCNSLSDNDLLCCIDGFDTVFNQCGYHLVREISERFKNYNCDILFSLDRKSKTAIEEYLIRRKFGKCFGHLLNAGLYIGKPRKIEKFWEDLQIDDDDQRYAAHRCHVVQDTISVKVDSDQTIFLNYNDDEYYVRDERLILTYSGSSPTIISGPAKKDLSKIIKDLNLTKCPHVKVTSVDNILKHNKKQESILSRSLSAIKKDATNIPKYFDFEFALILFIILLCIIFLFV